MGVILWLTRMMDVFLVLCLPFIIVGIIGDVREFGWNTGYVYGIPNWLSLPLMVTGWGHFIHEAYKWSFPFLRKLIRGSDE